MNNIIHNKYSECNLCNEKNWKDIDTLVSGVWEKNHTEIVRKELSFTISQCQNCHHIQIITPYTNEIFNTLYFSNTAEPDMWRPQKSGVVSPYEEMYDFFKSYLTENATIVDFGAGAGNTLKQIIINSKYSVNLKSVDFHNHINSPAIEHIHADLNQLEKITHLFEHDAIDIAISTHVLEHIIDPIKFLKNIGKLLNKNGVIFIEVPDCSNNASLDKLALTNLVHGQHIHYFSRSSIGIFAEKSGLKVLNIEQRTTDEVPRLLVLLTKNDIKKPSTSELLWRKIIFEESASEAIQLRFFQYRQYQKELFDAIKHKIDNKEKIVFWGIGGDFHLLTESYPELIDAIKSDLILLYDYELSGHTYKGKNISSSIELANSNIPIYIIPTYAPTRGRMKEISQKWGSNVIDIFEK